MIKGLEQFGVKSGVYVFPFELTIVREYWMLSFVLNNATHPFTTIWITAILEVYLLTLFINFFAHFVH